MIELLASNFPPLKTGYKTFTSTFFDSLAKTDKMLIASGYISVSSITELHRIIQLNNKPSLELIIGMHFFEGFTRPQYQAVKKLNLLLNENNLGNVYLAIVSMYHGKVYSFLDKESKPLESILGSSNLSTISTAQKSYETDLIIREKSINEKIYSFIS